MMDRKSLKPMISIIIGVLFGLGLSMLAKHIGMG
jgi:hypothetical protein